VICFRLAELFGGIGCMLKILARDAKNLSTSRMRVGVFVFFAGK
jgi:hypothetical protein